MVSLVAKPFIDTGEIMDIFASIPRKPLARKPVSRGVYECSKAVRVYELDLSSPVISKIPRCGIVYYTFQNDQLYFCFGRDRISRDLTDFGGQRKYLETPIECAVREGNEEARFAFGELTPENVQWFWCLYNSQMMIIFVHVATGNGENIFNLTIDNFNSAKMIPSQYIHMKAGTITISRCCDEISEMIWLNEDQIDDILSSSSRIKIYTPVKRFIRSCPQFKKSGADIRHWFQQINDLNQINTVTP